jgi:hypothetical protein
MNTKIKDLLPLFCIFTAILLFTLIKQWYQGFSIMSSMLDFMAGFFIVFGLFKIINLNNFVHAYSMYDIVAQRWQWYAYLYPFIEIALGLCYLFRFHLILANSITLVLMIIGSIGIMHALQKKESITCACLGAVFKLPMTYVSLAEDLIMGIMALIMLLVDLYQ